MFRACSTWVDDWMTEDRGFTWGCGCQRFTIWNSERVHKVVDLGRMYLVRVLVHKIQIFVIDFVIGVSVLSLG